MHPPDLARQAVEQLQEQIRALRQATDRASGVARGLIVDAARRLEAALAAMEASAGGERPPPVEPDAVLGRVSDAFIALDAEWRFTFVNRAAEAAMGMGRAELLGRGAWDVFPRLVGTGLHQMLHTAMQEQAPQHVEDYIPGFDRWFSIHAYPSADGISVYFEDIEDRKAAEADRERLIGELQAERALLDQVIQQMPVGVLVVEPPTGRVLTYNRAAQLVWHDAPPVPHEVEQYTEVYRCFHLDGRPYTPAELPGVRAVSAGETVTGEEMLLAAGDQPPRVLSVNAGPVRGITGEIVAGVVTFRDVTEHKQQETEGRFLDEVGELLNSSLDYRATVQSLAQLCARSLAEYVVVHVEERDRIRGVGIAHRDPAREEEMRAILRRLPLEVGGQNPVVMALRRGEPELLREVDEAALARLAPVEEDRALLRDLGLASILIVPLKARGRTLGTLSMARTADAPPFGEAELPLAHELARRAALAVDNARLYREARRAVEVREQLLGVVSHDLRNALNAGLMNADLLLEITPAFTAGTPQKRQMEALRHSLDHMHRLVQDLLDVDNIESGRLSLHTMPLDTSGLEAHLRHGFESLARERNVTLEVAFDPGLPPLRGDADRVVQVFTNLISNALGFTPAGGRVTVSAERSGERVLFRVADTGPGIPAEEIPRLFDRYWKSRLRQSHGSGLGLTIARGLVQAQGGDIWVESRVGEGTTFFVALPAAE